MNTTSNLRPRNIDSHFGDTMSEHQPLDDDLAFTMSEAAEILDVPVSIIHRLMRNNVLPIPSRVWSSTFFVSGTGPEPLICASYVYDLVDAASITSQREDVLAQLAALEADWQEEQAAYMAALDAEAA